MMSNTLPVTAGADAQIMMSTTMSCFNPPTAVAYINKKPYTAQQLLALASTYIPTTIPVAQPLFGYNICNNMMPVCLGGVSRGAFEGDLVCVSKSDQADAQSETSAGESTSSTKNHYAKNANATDYSYSSKFIIPYGTCDTSMGFAWRQAYMGDYVCVTLGEQGTVANDNADGAKNVACPK
jgi:hypothetical protein